VQAYPTLNTANFPIITDQGLVTGISVSVPHAHNFVCAKHREFNVTKKGFGAKAAKAYHSVAQAMTQEQYSAALDVVRSLTSKGIDAINYRSAFFISPGKS
jgi:hypothetical protein